jgi:1,4-alpha-glucan branching enzyme
MQIVQAAPTRTRRAPARRKTPHVELCQIVKEVDEEIVQTKNGGLKEIKIHVEFNLIASEAKWVAVAGSFNGWNPKKTPLEEIAGAWHVKVELPRGRYEYRFVIDGQWVTDPNARESVPNPFGSVNSVVSV